MNEVHYIESDPAFVLALQRLLRGYGIDVQGYASAPECLTAINELGPTASPPSTGACVLVSEDLLPSEPEARQDAIGRLCLNSKRLPCIVVLESADRINRAIAMHAGANGVIERRVLAAFLKQRLISLGKDVADLNYPKSIALKSGLLVGFRIMQPDDAVIQQDFVRNLSSKSRYSRFFSAISELSPALLEQFTNAKFPMDNALIATAQKNDKEEIVGVGRYGTSESDGLVDFAVVVADDWQRQGLASLLMSGLVASATIAGVKHLTGMVLRHNRAMLQLAKSFGFSPDPGSNDPEVVHLVKQLRTDF